MFRLIAVLFLPLVVWGGDWHRFRSGPFEVLSSAGMRPGRAILNELEQVRFVFGRTLGQPEMEAVWPFRVVVLDSAREARRYRPGSWRLGRDAWMLAVEKNQKLPTGELVRILLEANTQRMPEDVERGLLEVYNGVEVDGTMVTVGVPPPAERRDEAWARMHMLAVSPAYASRARVMFSNLQQGADWHSAYKNAFAMTPEQMDAAVEEYLAAARYSAQTISGAPISTRDFSARDFDPEYIETALADLLEGEEAGTAYGAILSQREGYAPALEGLGRYEDAAKADSLNARCWLQFGKLLRQPATARNAFARAAKLNPRWDEPYVHMAALDTNLPMKIRDLESASRLNPRNATHWKALATAHTEAKQYREAAQAWGGAMRAAESAEERESYYQARMALEERRSERYTSERIERAEERQTEQRRLREEWAEMMRRAKETENPEDPEAAPDVVEWWDDPRPRQRIRGKLTQVDCLRGVARLAVEDAAGEVTQILVRNPGEIVLLGGEGEQSFGCGPQDPVRRVVVEYYEDPDAQMQSAGEVALIEFR